MSKKKGKAATHSRTEKIFALFALLTGTGIPTNPHAVLFETIAPEGLAIVCSAASPAEGDLIRQILRDAGFHVEYVPAVTTGVFGTSGSAHVFVHASEEREAREFLSQLREKAVEEQNKEDQM